MSIVAGLECELEMLRAVGTPRPKKKKTIKGLEELARARAIQVERTIEHLVKAVTPATQTALRIQHEMDLEMEDLEDEKLDLIDQLSLNFK